MAKLSKIERQDWQNRWKARMRCFGWIDGIKWKQKRGNIDERDKVLERKEEASRKGARETRYDEGDAGQIHYKEQFALIWFKTMWRMLFSWLVIGIAALLRFSHSISRSPHVPFPLSSMCLNRLLRSVNGSDSCLLSRAFAHIALPCVILICQIV